MVRKLVGILLAVGRGELSPLDVDSGTQGKESPLCRAACAGLWFSTGTGHLSGRFGFVVARQVGVEFAPGERARGELIAQFYANYG